MAKDSKDSADTVASRMKTSDFQYAQKIDPRDLRDPKDSEVTVSPRLQISDLKPERLTIPPGIPPDVWLGLARMRHLLDLKKADLIMRTRDKERKINFVKDVLEVLFSILPEVADAIGRRRTLTEDEALIAISAMADIAQSYAKNM
jgi:hypothetical protein